MRIFNDKDKLLHEALNVSSKRFNQIANNIANVNTPGYIAQDMDFAAELKRSLGGNTSLPLARTNPNHIPANVQTGRAQVRTTPQANYLMRNDGNNVDIEKEVAALVENNLYYSGVATGLSNKFKLLQSVLQGGRQ